MEDISPAIHFLQKKDIQFSLFRSSQGNKTIEEAAEERNQVVSQIIRTIIFRLDQNKYVYTLIPGNSRVNWKTLRNFFNTNRITMASRDEVFQTSGYKIGTVSPFGIKMPSPIILDPSVLIHSHVSIGSGLPHAAIMIKSTDIIKAIPTIIQTKIIE